MRRMTETISCDVLVVGLGPAGCQAAAEASARGLKVIGVDRRQRPGEPVQCAEFIPALLGNELETPSAARRQPITGMATFVEDLPTDYREDFRGQMIDRAEFDRRLLADAQAKGADCRFGAILRNLDADGGALLSNGVRALAKIIVGADGPRSAVGAAIGQVNRHLVETRQVTVPLLRPYEATDIFLSAGLVGGYGWMFPKGEFANIGAGVAPAAKARLKRLVSNLHARLMAEGRVGPGVVRHTGGAIPVGGMLAPHGRLGKTGVLLAGDAAGLANPVTGAGIPAAVISGRLAGEAAAAIVAGEPGAAAEFEEELTDLFGASLDRAVKRRRDILAVHAEMRLPRPMDLRRTWIAYPEYWAA